MCVWFYPCVLSVQHCPPLCLTVLNPDLEDRSNGRVHIVGLYSSAHPDLQIRIHHWCLTLPALTKIFMWGFVIYITEKL